MTRSLITAADCFIGSWLAESLVADGAQVFGGVRRDPGERGGVARRVVDIRDPDAVTALVGEAAPDVIYHLAAQSNVKQSVDDPAATLATNVLGSTHLFEAVRVTANTARVVSVGSSAEYGETASPASGPLRESDPLAPRSPYGVSKVAQGQLARIYTRAHSLHIVHVRPFAVIGPRKQRDAISDWCINIARIERGETNELAVGELVAVRDFVDVRDAVRALRLIADHGVPGETYNLCHGTGVTLRDVIDMLRSASRVPFKVVTDPSRTRGAVDDLHLVGDPKKLAALGYAPRHTLADTLAATLDYWRAA